MKYDSDSVKHKIRGHFIFLVVALLGSAMFVLRGTFGGQSADAAGVVAAGVTGFVALAHVLLFLCVPLTFSLRHVIALLLVVLAPLGFLYPTTVRPDQGWPFNPGNGPREVGAPRSRIIAPGDTVSVSWSPDGTESVGALWRGRPEVKVVNADEVGCPSTLSAVGRNDSWNSVIWTKGSLAKCPPTLSARFRIPDDAQLAGKSLKFEITLPFSYPAPQGKVSFVDKKKTVVRIDEVQLASADAKQIYWTSWKRGAAVGLFGTMVGGLMLVWLAFGLRRSGHSGDGGRNPLSPYGGSRPVPLQDIARQLRECPGH